MVSCFGVTRGDGKSQRNGLRLLGCWKSPELDKHCTREKRVIRWRLRQPIERRFSALYSDPDALDKPVPEHPRIHPWIGISQRLFIEQLARKLLGKIPVPYKVVQDVGMPVARCAKHIACKL